MRSMIRDKSPSFDRETRPDPAARRLTRLDIQPLCLGSWAAAPILMHLAAVRQAARAVKVSVSPGPSSASAAIGVRQLPSSALRRSPNGARPHLSQLLEASALVQGTCGIVVARIHVMAVSY